MPSLMARGYDIVGNRAGSSLGFVWVPVVFAGRRDTDLIFVRRRDTGLILDADAIRYRHD